HSTYPSLRPIVRGVWAIGGARIVRLYIVVERPLSYRGANASQSVCDARLANERSPCQIGHLAVTLWSRRGVGVRSGEARASRPRSAPSTRWPAVTRNDCYRETVEARRPGGGSPATGRSRRGGSFVSAATPGVQPPYSLIPKSFAAVSPSMARRSAFEKPGAFRM